MYKPKNGIAGLHVNSIFNFLRTCQTVVLFLSNVKGRTHELVMQRRSLILSGWFEKSPEELCLEEHGYLEAGEVNDKKSGKEIEGEIGLGVLRVEEGEDFKDERRIGQREGSSFRNWIFFFFNLFKCFYERNWEAQVWSLGRKDPLEEDKAIHASVLAWRIPWTEEPGGLQSMGSQRVGHECSDRAWALYVQWLLRGVSQSVGLRRVRRDLATQQQQRLTQILWPGPGERSWSSLTAVPTLQ